MKSLALALSLVSLSALADPPATHSMTLTADTVVQEIELAGSKSRTLYRSEDYETTCSREVPVTVYRYECDYQNEQRCHTVPGTQSCTSRPVCTEVNRPVCNSHGCTSHSTRECTSQESCSNSPDWESCTTERVPYNCGDRPYTEYQTEIYACTQTRSVPIGTELVEDLTAHVTVAFAGNLVGISGKDTFQVAIANGLDVLGEDVTLKLIHSEDTHFLKLRRTLYEKTSEGEKRASLKVAYRIEAQPITDALGLKTTVANIDADRGQVLVDFTGAKLDAGVRIHLSAEKDQRIGGLIPVASGYIDGDKVKAEKTELGERGKFDFEDPKCFRRRPYEFTVTATRSLPASIREGLLNPNAVKKLGEDALVSKLTKRIKLSGPKHPQCDKE